MENNNNSNEEETTKLNGIISYTRFWNNPSTKQFIKHQQYFHYLENEGKTISKIVFTIRNQFYLLSNGMVFMKIPSHLSNVNEKETLLKELITSNIERKKMNAEIVQNIFENIFHQLYDKQNINLYFLDISAGDNHILLLDNEHFVWGYGDNSYNQIDSSTTEYFQSITKIEVINQVRAIYAIKNNSIAIKDNGDIYIWGSIEENFAGKKKKKKEGKNRVNPIRREDLIMAVQKTMKNYPGLIFDDFLLSNKHLGSNFNQIQILNQNLVNDIEIIAKKIENSLNDFNARFKEYSKMTKELKKGAKMKILVDLTDHYYGKLDKYNEEREYYYDIIDSINDELKQYYNDIENTFTQTNTIERNIEEILIQLNLLEIEQNNSNKKKKGKNQSLNKKAELDKANEEKEAMKKTLKLQYDNLVEKTNEKLKLYTSLKETIDKENAIYEKRFLIEDMIKIVKICDKDITNNSNANNVLQSAFQEKNKENIKILLFYMQKLDSFSYLQLNEIAPFKKVEEIIHDSNSKLNKIKANIDDFKVTLQGSSFQNYMFIIELIQHKVKKIEEQNQLILHVYHSMSHLKVEQLTTFFSKYYKDDPFFWCVNNNVKQNLYKQKEYLIKEIIYITLIETFDKDTFKEYEKNKKQLMKRYTETKFKKEIENYISNTEKMEKMYNKREKEFKETSEDLDKKYTNFSSIQTYSYTNSQKNKEKSMWSWFGDILN